MTGWNLPPGCSVADIDRAMGTDAPCLICSDWPDNGCQCPECPVCGAYGDQACYIVGHPMAPRDFMALGVHRGQGPLFHWDGTRFYLLADVEVLAGKRGRDTLVAIQDMLICQDEELMDQERDAIDYPGEKEHPNLYDEHPDRMSAIADYNEGKIRGDA